MNSVITGLTGMIASLVPAALPQHDAEAACKSYCLGSASCNAGDFFTKFRYKICGTKSTFEGCCG